MQGGGGSRAGTEAAPIKNSQARQSSAALAHSCVAILFVPEHPSFLRAAAFHRDSSLLVHVQSAFWVVQVVFFEQLCVSLALDPTEVPGDLGLQALQSFTGTHELCVFYMADGVVILTFSINRTWFTSMVMGPEWLESGTVNIM